MSDGSARDAAIRLYRAVVASREDLESQQALCRLVYQLGPALDADRLRTDDAAPAGELPLVSVVVCSIDSAKFERVRASYARAFGASPWELVGIHDARSLAEGYTRGLARSRGAIVVFSHDDIDILTPGLHGALCAALAAADVVGIAGATQLRGPAFAWGGKRYTRGRFVQPVADGNGLELLIFNPAPDITTGMQALDGVFIAARREVAQAIGFDAVTFDGFHLYDIDFTYRAHLGAYRVAATGSIVLRHDSKGSFDARWEEYARRFALKFPGVMGPREANYFSRVPFPGPAELLAFCERLDAVGRLATQSG
jgi:Glycosyltransferase like family